MRLWGDEAFALEDAPDGRDGGNLSKPLTEVVLDRLGTGVVAGSGQLAAQLDDKVASEALGRRSRLSEIA